MKSLDSYADQIRQRLSEIVAQSSQSEVARRTGATRNNVSRYVRGSRVPVEFAAAMIEGLGINPVWLLTGEGARSLTDVREETSRAASGLLDLVNAMTAISKLKLGALAGRDDAKKLRELSDALSSYEELHKTLWRQTRPVFQEMINDLKQAVEARDFQRANALKPGLEQLSRFCTEPELLTEMRHYFVRLEARRQNYGKALELQREVFYQTLRKAHRFDGRDCENAHNFARILVQSHLMAEAQSVCAATRSLVMPRHRQSSGYRKILVLSGWIEAERGNIRRALRFTQKAYPLMSEAERHAFGGAFLRPMLFSGSLTPRLALQAGFSSGPSGQALLTFAAYTEDLELLGRIVAKYAKSGTPPGLSYSFAQFILNVSPNNGKSGFDEFKRSFCEQAVGMGIPDAPIQAMCQVLLAQASWGRRSSALSKRATLDAQTALANLPEEYAPPLLIRAAHHRNVLRVLKEDRYPKEHRLARAFFQRHRSKGYAFFETQGGTYS